MAKRLIPTLNRILVEKIVPPTKTNTGILLPEKTAKVLPGRTSSSFLFLYVGLAAARWSPVFKFELWNCGLLVKFRVI